MQGGAAAERGAWAEMSNARSRNARTRRTGSSRCGFTLAELIVVLVLTAIMAGVAIPATCSVLNTQAKVAARQMARDLTYARQRAIATGRTTWVVFNAAADQYTMLEEPTNGSGRASATALVDPATGAAFMQRLNTGEFGAVDLLGASIGGGSEIGFDWRGRPRISDAAFLGATATITLTNATVTVQPETGLARWQ